MNPTIVSIHRTTRVYDTITRPGEALTMSDGSVWFHPYSGGAPVCVVRSEAQRRIGGSFS